jgi:hypothetical protein
VTSPLLPYPMGENRPVDGFRPGGQPAAGEQPRPGAGYPAVPRPMPTPATLMPGPTGHHAVDAAVRAVANAEDLPAAEQLAAYEAAHRTLREVLSSIDAA